MASNFPSHARHPREEHHIRLSKRPPFDPSSYRHASPKTANAGSAAPPIRHVHRPARILKAAAIVSKEHHEKYNGNGYPKGLKGEEIHIFARITAVADVFDALGSDRIYKKAWEDKKIFELFNNEKGEHFDPKIIDIFFENLEEIKQIRDKFKDI
jgi:response regulator RpfG family c-di-GMP phosphodiesterase